MTLGKRLVFDDVDAHADPSRRCQDFCIDPTEGHLRVLLSSSVRISGPGECPRLRLYSRSEGAAREYGR